MSIDLAAALATLAAIYIILASSVRFVIGDAGILSFAHGAFWGIGGYAGAIVALHGLNDLLVEIPIAFGIAFAVGLAVGGISIRLREELFVIATLGFFLFFVEVTRNWTSLTKGSAGLVGIPPMTVFGIAMSDAVQVCCLTCGVALILVFGMWLLSRSQFALQLRLVRASDEAAASFGIHAAALQVSAFAVSSGIAAIAGVLYTHYAQFIDPTTFGLDQAVNVFAMVAVGGLLSPLGAVVGALLLGLLPDLLQFVNLPPALSGGIRTTFLGVALVLIPLFRPEGIISDSWGRSRRRWSAALARVKPPL